MLKPQLFFFCPTTYKAYAGLLLCVLSLIFFNSDVLAQDTGSQLSVSPPTAFIKVKPGSKASHTITIENAGTTPITVLPIFHDFTSDGRTGLPDLKQEFTFPYLNIPPGGFPQLTIPARSKGQLTLMLAPPASAKEGEYAFSVVFTSATTQGGESTSVSQGIGSNLVVLVTNQDKLPSLIDVEKIQVARLADSFAELRLDAVLKNNGLSAQVASGSAQLKNWQGQVVADFTLYPDIILSNSTRIARSLQFNTQAGSDDNPYSAAEIAVKPSFRIGIYTWQFNLINSADSRQTQKIRVLVLPYVLLVLTVIGGSLLIGWDFLRKRNLQTI